MKFHVIPYMPVRTGQGAVAEAPVLLEGQASVTATVRPAPRSQPVAHQGSLPVLVC